MSVQMPYHASSLSLGGSSSSPHVNHHHHHNRGVVGAGSSGSNHPKAGSNAPQTPPTAPPLGTNIHIRSPNSSSPFSSSANASNISFHSYTLQGRSGNNSSSINNNSSPQLSHINSFQNLPSLSQANSPYLPPKDQQQQQEQQQQQLNRLPTSSSTITSSTTTSTAAAVAPSTAPTSPKPASRSNTSPIMTAGPSFASNKPASTAGSLYQKCASLKDRLETVPGLDIYIDACYSSRDFRNSSSTDLKLSTTANSISSSGTASPPTTTAPPARLDPVTFVWRFLRLGSSLCALFNVLEPNNILKAQLPEDVKQSKRAVYDFVQGCKAELGYSDTELFTISNVFSDNTSDLLKVIRTVQLLLDTLETRGLIAPVLSSSVQDMEPKDKRDKVVQELLVTERKFVQDMEILYDYQNELQKSGILSVDTIHALFPNLSTLVDFQRRFLVGVEYNATLPPQEQRFGSLFETMEEGIEVYKGYSLNQQNACDIASQEVSKLQAFSHLIEPTYELPCILIKPIQRICKYPLLLKELIKYTPPEWPYYQELLEGLEAIKRITNNVNESQRKVENGIVMKELQERLRDWRGHNLEDFGELLHEGVFPVVKTGFEREYHLYLFENIILCCKESNPQKKGMNLTKKNKGSSYPSNSSSMGKRSSLVLKGRIYMAYITNVAISKRDGYFLHISWGKDDASDTGYFDIRFRHEELLNQWESTIRKMVARYQESINDAALRSTNNNKDGSAASAGMINGTTYEDGSDDDYTSDFAASKEQLDPFDPSQFSPVSESTVNGPRTLSSSSTNTSYPFPYQQNIGMMSEDLHAFKISEGSRESSQVSLPAANNSGNSRSRSASTPSFSNPNGRYPHNQQQTQLPPTPQESPHYHPGQPTTTTQQQNLPPMPPLPTNKAARIKSEGAVDRYGYASSSQGSGSSTASSAGRSVSTAATSTSGTNGLSGGMGSKLKVRLHFLDDTFLIMVPETINYAQLLERIERKIRLCGKQTPSPLRIKYKDEDDDFVSINSDEDIGMALEQQLENNMLTIWVA